MRFCRNGTISYIQIIKRDQIRPPVRPVCRKLGVTKLSEINSEAELYEALTSISNNQLIKLKDNEVDGYESGQSGEAPKSARLQDATIIDNKFSSLGIFLLIKN